MIARGVTSSFTLPGIVFRRVLTASLAACIGAALILSSGCATVPQPADGLSKFDFRTDKAGIEAALGIRPIGVWLTAANTMLELRFDVVDPVKSHSIFDRQVLTYLQDQVSGDKFAIPTDTKIGPLRSSSRTPIPGKEYFILFVNPGRLLKRGNKVNIFVGATKIENFTVE